MFHELENHDNNPVNDTLFDNPFVNSARQSMSKEQLDDYERKGKCMFEDVDFDKVTETGLPPFFEEPTAQIEECIKSGLHISMLTDNEKNVMKEVFGEKWYQKYGFVKEDLDDIVTIKY
jgi:hypothetical protein